MPLLWHWLTLQVLLANATPGTSHVSPAFIPVFGDCIRMLRKVLYAEKTGQPILIAGSGTMGWDGAAANLVEPGEDVVSTRSLFRLSATGDVYGYLRLSDMPSLLVKGGITVVKSRESVNGKLRFENHVHETLTCTDSRIHQTTASPQC